MLGIVGALGAVAAAHGQLVFNWTGNNLITALGVTTFLPITTLNITTSADHDFNGMAVDLGGTVNWAAGNIRGGNGAFLNNTGQWNDNTATDQQFNAAFGGSARFENTATGTYTKTAASQTAFYLPFNNAGALNVQAGSIYLGGGGSFTGTGTATTTTGTTLYFGSNYTVPDGSKLTGTGDFVLYGGTLDLSGTVSAPGFKLQGGTLVNSQTFNSTVPWTGTELSTAGTTTIGTSGVFTVSGTADHNFNGRALVNDGTMNWTDGFLRTGNGGSITNHGAFNDSASGTTPATFNLAYGGAGTFTNTLGATYTKTGTGQTNFGAAFVNAGTLSVSAGLLNLTGGGSFASTGVATVAAGTTLYFNSNYALADGATLNGAGTYWLYGGTLTMDGTLTVGDFPATGGTLAGAGTLNIGTLTLAGASLGGNAVNLTGPGSTWSTGDMNGSGTTTIGATGTLTISGTNDHNLNARTFVNHGAVTWADGNLRSGNGGSITNHGAWTDATPGQLLNAAYGGSFSFTNASTGTYTKTVAGQTAFYIPFTNAGALNLQAGTLYLGGGGSFASTATAAAAAGTTLYFGSDYAVADGASLLGAGTYMLYSSTLTMSGTVGVNNFLLAVGTLAGTQTFAGGVTWAATELGTAGTTTNALGSTLTISGANTHNFNGRALVNNGTVNWTDGFLRSGGGGTFTNNAAFNDSASTVTDQQLNAAYGGSVSFTNAFGATYTKTGTGQTNFYVPFFNSGALVLSAGYLNLQGGGSFTSTGTATAAAGTTLYFNSDYAVADGASLLGAGTYMLYSSTLTMSGTVGVNNFLLAVGTLAGTQTFAGGVTWAATELGTAGTTTNALGSTLTISGANTHNFNGRALVNNGTVNWTDGFLRSGGGGTFTNNAAFNDSASTATDQQLNAAYGGSVSFTNAATGTYTKTGPGQTNFYVPFVNSGTVSVAAGTLAFNNGFTNTGGALRLAGGNLSASAPLDVGTGSLGGSGTVSAPTVTAGGVVAPGNPTGLLAIAGNLTLLATATSQFEIGGLTRGTHYDAIDVTGAATLGGTLSLSFLNGAYASLLNTDTFTLLSAGSLTGAFSNIASGSRLNSADGAGSFQVDMAGNTLLLSQFVIAPTTYLWTGGDLNTVGNITPSLLPANTVPAGNFLTISTAADHDFNATAIINHGTVTWTGGILRSGNGGSITNHSLFFDAADSSMNAAFAGTPPTFTNAADGTYRKTGTGTTSILIPFVSIGTIDVLGGVLELRSASTFNDGAVTTGPAVLRLAAGTLAANGTTTFSNLQLAGGTVLGTQTLAGTVNWLAGDFNSAGTTTLAAGGVLNVSAATFHDFSAHALVNRGTVNWLDGALRSGNGGTFTNLASFNDSAPASLFNNDYAGTLVVFTNAAGATYAKTAGTTTFTTTLVNAGTITVTGGTLSLDAGGTFADGSVLNNPGGTAQLAAGTLTAAGTVSLTNFRFNGGALAGTATLAGTMDWRTGDFSGAGTVTFASGSTLTVSTATFHDFNARALVNAGTVNWIGGTLRSGNAGTFTNLGLFDDRIATLAHAFNNDYAGTPAAFVNAPGATFAKTGTGQGDFTVLLNNAGTVSVSAGTLNLAGGGTAAATGAFNAATGTTVLFTNNYTVAAGAALTGAGTYQLAAGVLTLNTTVGATNFLQTGGNLSGTPTFLGTSLVWNNGNWNSAGDTATLAAGAVLAIATAADHDHNARLIVNDGTVNWTAGNLRSGNGGGITNRAIWNDSATGEFNNAYAGATATFTNSAGATYTKTAGLTSFGLPLVNAGTVSVTGGTLNFYAGATLTDGSVTGASGGGVAQLLAGTLTATGTVGLPGFTFNGGVLAGTSTLAGTISWLAGDFSGAGTVTFSAASTLTIAGGNDHDFDARALVTAGTVHWLAGAGRLRSGNGGSILNTGTWNDSATSAFNNDYGTVTFTNAPGGTYAKAAGNTTFLIPFVNAGTVSVSGGTLTLAGGGAFTAGSVLTSGGGMVQLAGGTFTADRSGSGALIWLAGDFNGTGTSTFGPGLTLTIASGADHDFNARALVTAGTVNWTAGRLRSGNGGSILNTGTWNDSATSSVNNDYGFGTVTFTNAAGGTYAKTAGSTTFLIPFVNSGGTVNVTGGTLALAGGGAFTAGSVLTSGGGAVQLAGGTFSADTLASGMLTWGGGNFNGTGISTFGPGLTLNVASGADHDFDTRALVTAGTVNWTAGRLRSGNGGSILNTGTWNDSASSAVNNDYGFGAVTFTNAPGGTYAKTAGVTTFLVPFINSGGTVNVTGGTLALAGGGGFTAGSVLTSGGGSVQLAGGTFTADTLASGTLTWGGGNFNGAGTSTFGPGLTLALASGADHDFDARALVTAGTVNWTAGRLRSGNGGSILNTGTWNDSASSAVNNDYGFGAVTFTNAPGGTYAKTAGNTTFLVPFVNAGTVNVSGGTLHFASTLTQTAGTLAFASGATAQFDTAVSLAGGTLTGTGTIVGDLTTAGLVAPGGAPGTLTISGHLTLATGAVTQIELGGTTPGTGHDKIVVTGNLTLGGALALSFVNNFQASVQPADTFTIFSAGGALTGGFANIASGGLLATFDGAGTFNVFYGVGSPFDAGNVVLTGFVPVPEPATWTLLALGAAVVALAARRRR